MRTFLNILERWTGHASGIAEEPPVSPQEMRFVITKVIDGNTHYLRFCSTTGEPLWEDRITRDTELYNSSASAWREVNGYFLPAFSKMSACVRSRLTEFRQNAIRLQSFTACCQDKRIRCSTS